MKSTLLILATILLAYTNAGAQASKIIISNQDGIEVSYTLNKIIESKRTTTYLICARAENKNDFDVYYSMPFARQTFSTVGTGMLLSNGFAQLTVRNAKGLSGSRLVLKGNESGLISKDQKIIYAIPKGSFVINEQKIKVKNGDFPQLTNTFFQKLRSLEHFNIPLEQLSIAAK